MTEHAVIVTYQLSGDGFGSEPERYEVRRMEMRLSEAIDQAGVGELDGHEFGGGSVTVYIYGPDADALFATAEAALKDLALRPAFAVLRYGDADDTDAREVRVNLA